MKIHTAFIPSTENQIDEFIYKTPITGLLFVKTKKFADNRGFYAELARMPEIEKALDITFIPKQMNLSHSNKNVIRGLHAENWNKLLTVTHGTAFCAWVDVRPTSATFGDIVTMTLGTDETVEFGSVFVSAGIANSFCTLSETLDYLYTVDALYADRDPSQDQAYSLFDPDLNIPWPLDKDTLIISERDLKSIRLRDKFPEKF